MHRDYEVPDGGYSTTDYGTRTRGKAKPIYAQVQYTV